jgi:GTPase SAR1 family protein
MTDLTQNQLNDAKVVLIGHVGVGKSTLFLRFKEGRFVEDADAQVNMDTLAEHTKELGSGVKVNI